MTAGTGGATPRPWVRPRQTPDVRAGSLAFGGGLAIGNAGVLLALVRARSRAERRGDVW